MLIDDLDNHIFVRTPLLGIDYCMQESYKSQKSDRLSPVTIDDAAIIDLLAELLRQNQKTLDVAFKYTDVTFGFGLSSLQKRS